MIEYQLLLIIIGSYYAALNLLLFIFMAYDKHCAKADKRRLPEKRLLLLGLAGGMVGGLLGMKAFNHKTRKSYFSIIYILSIVLHIAIIFIVYKYLL